MGCRGVTMLGMKVFVFFGYEMVKVTCLVETGNK